MIERPRIGDVLSLTVKIPVIVKMRSGMEMYVFSLVPSGWRISSVNLKEQFNQKEFSFDYH